jgi:hypothetical protein
LKDQHILENATDEDGIAHPALDSEKVACGLWSMVSIAGISSDIGLSLAIEFLLRDFSEPSACFVTCRSFFSHYESL